MNPEHAEPAAAIKVARAAYPNLTPSGFATTDKTLADDQFSHEEIATALAFLKQCKPIKHPSRGSYGLKHMAEDWGEAHGLAGYVSNGALIVAAVALGFPIRRVGLNAGIAISRLDLKRVMKSFKNSW